MRELNVIKALCGAVAVTVLAASTAQAQDTRVVAVNYALQYMAERLLDGEAVVDFPVPADADPSFWRPSIADISNIQSADMILLNGAGFATWIDRVSLPRSRVVNTTAGLEDQFIVTESITHSHGEGEEHSHEGLASYTWLDPDLAAAQAAAIAAAITAKGLADEDAVAGRLQGLQGDLEGLEAEAEAALAPLEGTTIITTHPRYQYFAESYGLTLSALEWEAGAAPTAEELRDLETRVAETGATIMIWEAAPPAEAFAATEALGLTNVVFPPLARVAGQSFVESYASSVAALAAAAQ